jgi:hypothetical protein
MSRYLRRQDSKVNLPPPPIPGPPPPPPIEEDDEEEQPSSLQIVKKHNTIKNSNIGTPTGQKRKQRRASRMGYGRIMEASLDDIAKASLAQNRTASQASRHILNEKTAAINREKSVDKNNNNAINDSNPTTEPQKIMSNNLSAESTQLCWVKHETEGYVAAEKIDERKYTSLEKGVDLPTQPEIYSTLSRVNILTKEYDNMVHMDDVNEASILYNLKIRYREDKFMTNVGNILVSLNPFKNLDYLYTEAEVFKYHRWKLGDVDLPPHIYQIASRAYKLLQDNIQNQGIIISGESGAGKTVATKKCLQYLSTVAGADSDLADKILQANPILEAFGNAKTVRNNNSSRFGKWIEVLFSKKSFQITGARITNYLLEKPRLVQQAKTERNYHIFYQIFHDKYLIRKLKLASPKDYRLLTQSGCLTVKGVDDKFDFEVVTQAMTEEFKFPQSTQFSIFSIIAAILHLGNVKFEDDDLGTGYAQISSSNESTSGLKIAAELLKINDLLLGKNLLVQELNIRGDKTAKQLDANAASALRDSLIKAIYGKMFLWIVQEINSSMSLDNNGEKMNDQRATVCIGILDIFGFEIFEHNSFEQLCINFANEKLQQHFNSATFKDEEALYNSEDIAVPPVSFVDNQDLIDLIEKSNKRNPGLLVLLDEELNLIGAGSDANFLKKACKVHAANSRLRINMIGGLKKSRKRAESLGSTMTENEFLINHYAGSVKYNITGFLEKNKDELVTNLKEVMETSEDLFIRDVLFPRKSNSNSDNLFGRSKKESQGRQFRKQLKNLMSTLNSSKPHYIRCIKPNQEKRANTFRAITTLEQLRYSGLFEAVKIRKQGYPFRLKHVHFYQRYFILVSKQVRGHDTSGMNNKEKCKNLVRILGVDNEIIHDCQVGKTMMFYRPEQHVILEVLRTKHVKDKTYLIQRVIRGFLSRVYVRRIREYNAVLNDAMNENSIQEIEEAILETKSNGFDWLPLLAKAHKHLKHLQDVEKVNRALTSIQKFDPIKNFDEMKDIVDTAERLGIDNKALSDARKRLNQVRDLIETKRNLMNGIRDMDKTMLTAALEKCKEIRNESPTFCDHEMAEAKKAIKTIEEEEKNYSKLVQALTVGSASITDSGKLNIVTIRTKQIQTSLNALKNKIFKTKRGQNVLQSAKTIFEIRSALVLNDWDTVAKHLNSCEVEGETFVIPEAEKEIAFVLDEYQSRKVIEMCKYVMVENRIRGTFGFINVHECSISEMEMKLQEIEEANCRSIECKRWINFFKTMLSIRRLVVVHDWDSVSSMLLSINEVDTESIDTLLSEELELIRDEATNRAIITKLSAGLSSGRIEGFVGRLDLSNVSSLFLDEGLNMVNERMRLLETVQTMVYTAKFVKDIRNSVVSDLWEKVIVQLESYLNNKSLFYDFACDELDLVVDEANNRKILDALHEGILVGKITGSVDNINYDKISFDVLNDNIIMASKIGCKAQPTIQLLESCEVLRNVRKILKFQKFDDLVRIDTLKYQNTMNEQIQSEIELAIKEGTNQSLLKVLEASLLEGSLPGELGDEGNFAFIKTENLEDAVQEASKFDFASNNLVKRHYTGVTVLKLRKTLKDQDWETVIALLKNIDKKKIDDICINEIQRAQDEYENWKIISSSMEAIAVGKVTGTLNKPNIEEVHSDKIHEVFRHTSEMARSSKKAQEWTKACEVLGALRDALVMQNNTVLERAVDNIQHNKLPNEVLSEVELIEQIVRDNRVFTMLKDGILSGHIMGKVGTINREGIKYVALESAIKHGDEVSTLTTRTSKLLSYSSFIVKARKAVKYNEIKEYESVVYCPQPNLENIVDFAFSITNEMDLAKKECLSNLVIITMKKELSLGSINLVNEEPNINKIEYEKLEQKVMWAKKFTLVNSEAVDLVFAANIVCSMRKMVKKNTPDSLANLGEMLKKFQEIVIPREVDEEVYTIRDIYNNFKIVSSLEDALSTGMAVGVVGSLDLGTIEVGKIDDAIEMATGLKCTTARAKSLLQAASVIQNIRLALKFMEWEALSTILQELDHDIVISEISAEVAMAKNESNNHTVINELEAIIRDTQIVGEIGYLDTSNVNLVELSKSISLANRLGCKTKEAKQLESTAQYAMEVREYVLDGDWTSAKSLVDKYEGLNLSKIMDDEILLLKDEVDNRSIILELATAVSHGCICGVPGNIDLSEVNAIVVSEAIKAVEQIGCKSQDAIDMFKTAKLVYELRTFAIAEQWTELYDLVNTKIYDSGFQPHPFAIEEIELAQSEAVDVSVSFHLRNGILRGKLELKNGVFNLNRVATGMLESAIQYANESECSSERVTKLHKGGTTILNLRKAIVERNLTELESQLANPRNEPQEDDIIYEEYNYFTSYLNNINFQNKVDDAIMTTKILGEVGNIVFPKEYTNFITSISFGKAIVDDLTNENKQLLEISEIICEIRVAAFSNQWEEVEKLISNQITNNLMKKYQSELELLAAEAKNREVVIKLSDALTQDMPVGTIDNIDLASVSTQYLGEAIDFAMTHKTLTPAARLLVSSAEYIKELRASLLKPGPNWKEVRNILLKIKAGSVANIVEEEIDFISKVAEDGYIISVLNESYEVGKVTGSILDQVFENVAFDSIDNALKLTNTLVCSTKRAKQNILIASLIKRLRNAVMQNDLDSMDALTKEAYAFKEYFSAAAWHEVAFVNDVVRHRKIIKILSEGVVNGQVTGEVGKVNYHDIHVKTIDNCIFEAQEIGYVTEEAQKLLISTEALRRLRLELKGNQWLILQQTLQVVYETGVPPLLQKEIQLIKDECDDALMSAELIECMSEGEPIGTVGSFHVDDINPKIVETAIINAKKIKPKTLKTQRLLKTALLLFAVRTQMIAKEYSKIDEILEVTDMEDICDIINDEISFYKKVIRNFFVVRDLTDALRSGKPTRTKSRLDITTIRTKRLESAVNTAVASNLYTSEAEHYLSTCKVLLNLRSAVVNDNWKLVDQVLKDSRTINLADEVSEEIQCIQDLADDKNLVFELRDVLSIGMAKGTVGNIEIDTIDIASLDTAIAHATKVGCKTVEAKMLLDSAVSLRRIRAAWRVYYHDGIGELRETLKEIEMKNLDSIVKNEIMLATDEVNNHDICSKLEQALLANKVRGEVGQIHLNDVSTEELTDAIAFTKRNGCKTKKATLLFETAKLMRGVRIDILNDNWEALDSMVESVLQDDIAISDVGRPEFDLVQEEIADRKICSTLTKALSNIPSGVQDEKNLDELSKAIDFSEKIGATSANSHRLLNAANFVLELRYAFANANWRKVGKLLTGVSINLFPANVQPEVYRIRDHLLEHTARQKVVTSLKEGGLSGSSDDIDVSGISTDGLDVSLRYINAMSSESESIKYLEKIVVAVRRLRKATLDRDVNAQINCISYIDTFIGNAEKAWISEEIKLTKILMENEEACEQICSAMREGDGIGEPGALDMSTISTKDLRMALDRAKSLAHATPHTSRIISSGMKVLSLREAFRMERWYDIEEFASESAAKGGLLSAEERGTLGIDDADRVETELKFLISEVHIKKAIVLLRNAIMYGRPSFEGTHIDVATIDTTAIDNALEKAELAGVRAGEGQQLVVTAKYIKKMRLALLDGHWPNVISTIEQIDEIEASPFAAEEINQVKMYAHWHSSVRDVTLGLVNAIAAKNVEKLRVFMQRAKVLRLDQMPDGDISSIVIHANTLLVKLEKLNYELEDSLEQSHVQMGISLDKARRLSYAKSPNAKLVSQRLENFNDLEVRAKQAIEDIDVQEMKDLLQLAKSRYFTLSSEKELKKIVSLPLTQILQLQLRLYISRNDVEKIAATTIKVKDFYFSEMKNANSVFNIEKFPNLRNNDSNIKDSVDRDVSTILSFSKEPMETSLTILDEKHSIVSRRMFKYVLGYMGDRHFTHPITVAVEVIQTAYLHSQLRDELFLQIVKQLKRNPSTISLKRGHALLFATLKMFPPSEHLENYLEIFLRKQKLNRILQQLHTIVYLRLNANAPTLQDVKHAIDEYAEVLKINGNNAGSLVKDGGTK